MTEPAFWIAPLGVVSGLLFAALFYRGMLGCDPGNERMQHIGEHIHRGAMAYLNQQYRIMLLVFIGLALLFALLAYGFGVQNRWLPFTVDWWQWVVFGEVGRVAGDFDVADLHSDMKGDAGIGIRAFSSGGVGRLDVAGSEEGWTALAMFGHPF